MKGDFDSEKAREALHKLSKAIAVIQTCSIAMRDELDADPAYGPIAAALEVGIKRLLRAYNSVDKVLP